MAKLAFGVTGATRFGEVTNVSVSGSADALDVTHHGSAAASREFIAGLVDKGEVTISGYCNGSQTSLGELGKTRAYSFVFPDGATFAGNYLCTALSVDGPVDGVQTFSCTLKAGSVSAVAT